jgi:hypothetical protein
MSIVDGSVRWLLLGLLLVSCKNTGNRPVDASADASTDAGTEAGAGDDVESVYPVDPNAPAVPVAAKLCAALTEMPEKKRAACCSAAPGIVTTSECTRTLSAAIRHGAVTLDEKAIDACIAAFERTLEGCEWVGPFPPSPPAACSGIVKGSLGTGVKCRSSLECAAGQRCKGVGPTTLGVCAAPKAVGELCGGTVDALATYTRQTDEKQHPECATGHCIKHRCAEAVPENGACVVTADCAEGLSCLPSTPKAKTCVRKALPKEGEACPGGVCEGELSCIAGKCAVRKHSGEACTNDFECRGGCLKPDGGAAKSGTCGPRCDVR